MSAETRNFLGIFLLVIGVAGMLVFAVWAINLAYRSYSTAQTSGAAARYYDQGVALFNRGELDAAEQQFTNAVRVSPASKVAEQAKDGIYQVWIARAYAYSQSRNKEALGEQARRMIELRPNAPEGHYYLGLTYELEGKLQEAVAEYDRASSLAGNDEAHYGEASRARRDRLQTMIESSTPPQSAPAAPAVTPPSRPSDIPYNPGSEPPR